MTTELDPARLTGATSNAVELLLGQRSADGHWVGELSSSALSTATAVAALAAVVRVRPNEAPRLAPLIAGGRRWLVRHANADGGFGDTVDSPSNLSTTALAWMALSLPGTDRTAGTDGAGSDARTAAASWVAARAGGTDAAALADALEEVYGDDHTFAVPILTALAVSGTFGPEDDPWRHVSPLPFELAALPRTWFRRLGLPVVSYALPALIAVGQAIEHHRPSSNPLARLARRLTRERTLRVLGDVQPVDGGFLEATPLTSFVALALVSCDRAAHPVVARAVDFLVTSVRADGSWPIDTDLATWVTTLAIGALEEDLPAALRGPLREWLLGQQFTARHPYTDAAPGGWAWTDLPGGVPDADDTPGAVLALRVLGGRDAAEQARVEAAARAGLSWLSGLQNRDGGIPTFCRGWGRLPFDESCPDLTAHALRARQAWGADDARFTARATRFLRASQLVEGAPGAWLPLWFGNQEDRQQANPVYGTSRVLRAAGCAPHDQAWRAALERGLAWLLGAQGERGGFGGAPGLTPSVEETALALEGLCDARTAGLGERAALQEAITRAVTWLCDATDDGTRFEARPIGLYFAKLWYSERLYPLVFSVSALRRARRALDLP